MSRVQQLLERVQRWPYARRVGLKSYISETFIADAHRWNVMCQKLLTKGTALSTTHMTLCADIPDRFKSAIGDHAKEINDMVRNHEGEVREIDGAWVLHHGTVPTPWSHPTLYNAQYALCRQQYLALQDKGKGKGHQLPDPMRDVEQRYNNILALAQPAFGGGCGGFKVRVCKAIALAELFWFFGAEFTARELYAYYVNARRLVLCRPHPHTNADRHDMVRAHYASTGYWGLGNVGVNEYVRRQ